MNLCFSCMNQLYKQHTIFYNIINIYTDEPPFNSHPQGTNWQQVAA